MGKVYNSLLSGTSGLTGKIVVVNMNGVEISRSRPRRNPNNFTKKQKLAQVKFKMANQFLAGYKSLAINYFGKKKGLSSPYNQAMSNLLKAIEIKDEDLSFKINYDLISFSRGELPEILATNLFSREQNKITINWIQNDKKFAKDELLVLYTEDNNKLNQSHLIYSNCIRSMKEYTFSVLPKFKDKFIHVWAAFIKDDHSKISNSLYLGKVLIH